MVQDGRVPRSVRKESAVQFFVRFDVTQPANVSNEDLFAIWRREAEAALGAMEAGAVTHLWKVAGQRVVLGVVELPSAEDLDRALAGLPIVREMGAGVKTEAWPIYEYKTFAGDMNEGLHG
jgi:muconolactone delta-isomerase